MGATKCPTRRLLIGQSTFIVTTAEFGLKKKTLLNIVDPIWTEAYGIESQLSEKRNKYTCFCGLFNVALELSFITKQLERILYLLGVLKNDNLENHKFGAEQIVY